VPVGCTRAVNTHYTQLICVQCTFLHTFYWTLSLGAWTLGVPGCSGYHFGRHYRNCCCGSATAPRQHGAVCPTSRAIFPFDVCHNSSCDIQPSPYGNTASFSLPWFLHAHLLHLASLSHLPALASSCFTMPNPQQRSDILPASRVTLNRSEPVRGYPHHPHYLLTWLPHLTWTCHSTIPPGVASSSTTPYTHTERGTPYNILYGGMFHPGIWVGGQGLGGLVPRHWWPLTAPHTVTFSSLTHYTHSQILLAGCFLPLHAGISHAAPMPFPFGHLQTAFSFNRPAAIAYQLMPSTFPGTIHLLHTF